MSDPINPLNLDLDVDNKPQTVLTPVAVVLDDSDASLRHRNTARSAEESDAGEYTVPERISEPSTLGAFAAVEAPAEKAAVLEAPAAVESEVEHMPGEYAYDSDEEPSLVDVVKSTVQEAQSGIASLISTVRRKVSQGTPQPPSLETLRSAVPAPPSASTAGATTGSVVGTVAGTLTAASEIAASAVSTAGHSVAETVRGVVPEHAAVPTNAQPASVLPAVPSVTEKAATIAHNASDVASTAYQVAAEKAAVAGHVAAETAAVAGQTAASAASTIGERASEVRAVAAQSAAESYQQSAELTAARIEHAKEIAGEVAHTVKEAVVAAVHKVEEVAAVAFERTAHGAGVATGVAAETVHKATEVTAPVIASAANTVSNTAATARDVVGSAAATTYDTAASTTTSAKEAVVGAAAATYNTAANTATSAKEAVVGAAAATYNTTANTATSAKEAVVGTAATAYDKAATTGVAARDTVTGAAASTYGTAASTAATVRDTVANTAATAGATLVHAKDTVVGSAAHAAELAKAKVLGAKEAATDRAVAEEQAVVETTPQPGVLATAQEKLGSAVTAAKETAYNAAGTVAHAPVAAYEAAAQAASTAAAAVAAAPSTALNYVRGTSQTTTEEAKPAVVPLGSYPEYVQGEAPAPRAAAEVEHTYSLEEIKDAEEAERARRDKPGEVARQAFAHAQAEAAAFASGIREHLGESNAIPALAVPRREVIREAEEKEREERMVAEWAQRPIASETAHAFKEGIANPGDHLHSAVDVARSALIRDQEEEERIKRIESLEPRASLAVAAAVKEGLLGGDEAGPALGVARKELTRQAEEEARDEKVATAQGEEALAHQLAAAFQSELPSSSTRVADAAKKGRLDAQEEVEREDRIQSGWKQEARAHEQARLVAEGLDSVDLKHITSGPAQLKALDQAEEEERDRRIRDAAKNDYQPQAAPAVAKALREGLEHAHDHDGINNPAVMIANREIAKDLQEQEREEKLQSGESLRVSGSPTRTAFLVREGLLREDNPATNVARKIAGSEGVSDPLEGFQGKGITPSKLKHVESPTRHAYDTIKTSNPGLPTSTVPISDFGSHSPTRHVLGAEALPALGRAPEVPDRTDSILEPSDYSEIPRETQTESKTEQQTTSAPATSATTTTPSAEKTSTSTAAPAHERTDSSKVGLETIRPSPAEVAQESQGTLKQPDTETQERAVSPEAPSTDGSETSDKAGKKPKKLTGLLHKAVGKIELGLGKITHNDHLVERGEELHAAGAAEMHAAKTKASTAH